MDTAFDEIETGSPDGVVKAPAIRRLLEQWRVAPERAVYVGDAAADMQAAREAGVTAAGAAWAYGADETALRAGGADEIFTGVTEFVTWLESRTVTSTRS